MSDLVWIAGRAFSDYQNWECFQHGFYKPGTGCGDEHVRQAKALLSNSDTFWSVMQQLTKEWPVTTAVHLTNNGTNRRAWLGQTSCFYMWKVCRDCTVTAWMQMTEKQRRQANKTATYMVEEWNQQHSAAELSQQQSSQLVFPFLMPLLSESSERLPSVLAFT